jgi:hypothetical protein
MKLYNDSKVNDGVLMALLAKAGRSVGARTGKVIVHVKRGRHNRVSGCAYECINVKMHGRWIATDGGMFEIVIPRLGSPLKAAEDFLYVARHEWAHVRDYQHGGRRALLFSKRGSGGRRPRHGLRPEETRAEGYIVDSDERLRAGHFDEEVLNLAIEIERIQKG